MAMPWFISSSIIKDVSPFTFSFLLERPSDFDLLIFNGDLDPDTLLMSKPYIFFPSFVGEFSVPFLGPRSRFYLVSLMACSLVKQSQIPSHAQIMKSWSGLSATFLTSGNDDTWCFLASSIFLYGPRCSSFFSSSAGLASLVLLRF